MSRELLTTKQVAQLLKCSTSRVHQLVHAGALKTVGRNRTKGQSMLFDAAAIARYAPPARRQPAQKVVVNGAHASISVRPETHARIKSFVERHSGFPFYLTIERLTSMILDEAIHKIETT